ncbi:RCC1 domain-containing protein [Sandaracinus amylolyticus]|uniref:RCC1 domain-containing protein n=1 Tax=Sandaracinus amylolyticus TaxID=927083 RepID=UPI003AF373B9|nr:BNR repeat domain protein [Sandaracinus amylolyticus]
MRVSTWCFWACCALAAACETPRCGDPALQYDRELNRCICRNGGTWHEADGGWRCELPDSGATSPTAPDGCALHTFHRDADRDGFGDPASTTQACIAPSGYVDDSRDCNDACSDCRPDGTEVCDAAELDENCTGGANEGCPCAIGTTRECPDGSNTGECSAGTQVCTATAEWGACTGSIGPAAETCNGLDDDCDLVVDGAAADSSCGEAAGASAVRCSAGRCTISACVGGSADCDDDFANGCEETLGTLANCSSCGELCALSCTPSGCSEALSVGLGDRHTCVLREDGTIACWGNNSFGQLGDGTTTTRLRPIVVPGIDNAVAVAVGVNHTCALLRDDTVRCWGWSEYGQAGPNASGAQQTSPVEVIGFTEPLEITAGLLHTCVRQRNGFVRCWGHNALGQLGNRTFTSSPAPVTVYGIGGALAAIAISAGENHTCVVRNDRTVWCWGANSQGQLGDSTTTERNAPVAARDLTSAIGIAAGRAHTCAVQEGGRVSCWGANGSGQLGVGDTSARVTPVGLTGLDGVTAIDAGTTHSCVVRTTGGVQCWGSNNLGQLGTGTRDPSTTAVDVVGLGDAIGIRLGNSYSCTLQSNGGVRCWGSNTSGSLGDGTTFVQERPIIVTVP